MPAVYYSVQRGLTRPPTGPGARGLRPDTLPAAWRLQTHRPRWVRAHTQVDTHTHTHTHTQKYLPQPDTEKHFQITGFVSESQRNRGTEEFSFQFCLE